jgi:thioredoxin-like negative regulator of GroEL
LSYQFGHCSTYAPSSIEDFDFMTPLRIKFIWGSGNTINGRWYLGLIGRYHRNVTQDDGLAISIRGLLFWLPVLALLAYVALATMLFYRWQRDPYSLLDYTDALLYPIRRGEVAEKHGSAFIAKGTDLFRAKKYQDAANLLRAGLARRPQDIEARITLAEFYRLTNQRALALHVLKGGFGDNFPGPLFAESLVAQAEASEDFSLILEFCDRYLKLPDAEIPLRHRKWLSEKKFAALLAAGRPAEALVLADGEPPGNTATEHRVMALLALGRSDDALVALVDWRRNAGAELGLVGRLEIRALREAKRFAEMEQALGRLLATAPANPSLAAFGIVQRAMSGLEPEADKALEDFWFRFGGSASNLQMIAQPLGEIEHVALLRRCLEKAIFHGYPSDRFQVLLVQALMQQGESAAASTILASMPPPAGRDRVTSQFWREWMRSLIDTAIAPAGAGQITLLEQLQRRPWSIRIFRQSIEALLVSDRLEAAGQVASMAARYFPASSWMQNKNRAIADSLSARAASIAGNAPATTKVSVGPEDFFRHFYGLVERGQWAEAEKALRDVRSMTPPPVWLETHDPKLQLAQIRISHGLGNLPAMLVAVRLFLNGDADRGKLALDVARDFHAAGDRSSALVLAKEIVRSTPRFAIARKTLAEWEPPSKP